MARKVEGLGWSTLTIADHLDEALAPIPGLMAAADATRTLRLGTMVLANDYRHPVLVAKEAATIDLLSGGSLELGIGPELGRASCRASVCKYVSITVGAGSIKNTQHHI